MQPAKTGQRCGDGMGAVSWALRGKEHGTTAGEMILRSSAWKGAQCTPGAVLQSSCQGTLLEPMDRVILCALHLSLRHNTKH